MKREEFQIDLEFRCGSKQWKCTDVGTRVIVAIELDPSRDSHPCRGSRGPSWLAGPPYAVLEHVFDEDDQLACTLPDDPPRAEP